MRGARRWSVIGEALRRATRASWPITPSEYEGTQFHTVPRALERDVVRGEHWRRCIGNACSRCRASDVAGPRHPGNGKSPRSEKQTSRRHTLPPSPRSHHSRHPIGIPMAGIQTGIQAELSREVARIVACPYPPSLQVSVLASMQYIPGMCSAEKHMTRSVCRPLSLT